MRITPGEAIFRMVMVTGGHLVTWCAVLSGIIWLVRPEQGAEQILNRGCMAGAIVTGVLVAIPWWITLMEILAAWSTMRQRRRIEKAVNRLDLED